MFIVNLDYVIDVVINLFCITENVFGCIILMTKPNYKINNYCAHCELIYPKTEKICSNCHFKLRTHPASGIRNKKYLEMKARL